MIDMRGRQHHLGLPKLALVIPIIDPGNRPALPVPPAPLVRIEPATIAKMADHPTMGAPADLATAPCPLEPDYPTEFSPVDRIEAFELRSDRHALPLRLGQTPLGQHRLPIDIRKQT